MTAPDYPALALFVAGEWIGPDARDTMPVLDPATGEEIARLPLATAADLDRAVDSAAAAFRPWRTTPVMERYAILRRAAALMRHRLEENAALLTREQGKPIAQSRGELNASADFFDWYAEEARRAYGRVIPARPGMMMLAALREPVGPVAAFAPWNFPASQVARKLAPALAAGCSCVLKPSEETPGAALALARALDDAGLPQGVLNVVFGMPAEVSSHLIARPEIRKISFTGSTAIGKVIGRQAAEQVKRVTLELGGHAPVIVMDDVDVEKVARASVATKFRNAGQVCTSPTRFLVQDGIHDRFVAEFARAMGALRVGNGLDPASDMGPLANARREEAVDALVQDAVDQGGHLVGGGERLFNAGHFRAPALVADVPLSARAMHEEPFGPVAMTRRFATIDDAIVEANRLPYGLAAYAFTRDRDHIARLRDEVESGMIGVNGFSVTWPDTPFGGVKESGYGSEGGSEGLDAYLVTKFISEA
ncbi:MAG: aldehyde dehydrogenase [Sphingomonas bacterium]|uniref:NAD-dependent succinate-semialdehyde dehydrogenase n=1 Tax=Sphingomonas bacterium TaxID=1895847 RepID=UPI002611D451|nr:NAD-dependent succinate-semialdehyde dehydrogenase [Sphingomonas bacterium]MDB5707201.1 aldehyde dehydrogenase [Sphingomonas bacterium]